MLLSCFCFSAFAVDSTDTMIWSAEYNHTMTGGYPRMAQRADGTLLLTTGSGNIWHSTDKGETWTKQSKRTVANAATTATITKDGTEYTFDSLTRANFQPFVVSDGTVLLGYRSHTSSSGYTAGNPFYTSIRVLTSTDGGVTFDGEEILVEDVATGFYGFWEPFFVQIDENTVACYYADDINVYSTSQQRIAYVTYDITTKTWNKTPKIAIYRGGSDGIDTRDGMPMVTTLIDGTFAMVVEVQDFASWMKVNTKTGTLGSLFPTYTNTTFVVGLALSEDGKTWSDPVPVFGAKDLTAGNSCAAPSIATLADGRIIITCQDADEYTGDYGESITYMSAMAVAISDEPITKDTILTAIDPTNPNADGAADGFTRLEGVFDFGENEYSIWNGAFSCGNDLYLMGGAGTNLEDDTRTGAHTHIRRLTSYASTDEKASYTDAASRAGDNMFVAAYGLAESGKVSLNVPTDAENVYIYRMDDGGFLTKMELTVKDGVATFTDDGGYYAVSDTELVTYGDATADGKIGLADVIRVIKYTVNSSTALDIAASDMDASLSIDVQDAMKLIQNILK